jgi:hypothetical protein
MFTGIVYGSLTDSPVRGIMWKMYTRERWDPDQPYVIPHSEIAGTKPPYVCPECFIHTYSNNMINRFHVQ